MGGHKQLDDRVKKIGPAAFFSCLRLRLCASGRPRTSADFFSQAVLSYMPADAKDPWQTPGLEELITFVFIVTLWPMIALSAKRLA